MRAELPGLLGAVEAPAPHPEKVVRPPWAPTLTTFETEVVGALGDPRGARLHGI